MHVYRKNNEISDLYMSLSYNSPDFQYKADFGCGDHDFQYTCPRASCEQRACA
jgi:hypothetical protein